MSRCADCGRALGRNGGKTVETKWGVSYVVCRLCAIGGAPTCGVEPRVAQLGGRGLALRGYQVEGVRWLAPRWAALLADSPGLGKSCQTLMAIPDDVPVLALVPANVRDNWLAEAATWRPDLRANSHKGPRRRFRWPEPGEFLSATYEGLPDPEPCECGHGIWKHRTKPGRKSSKVICHHCGLPDFDCLCLRCGVRDCLCRHYLPDPEGVDPRAGLLTPPPEGLVLICDEAHKVKNPRAIRTRRMRWIARRALASRGRVWLVTATPILNRPSELYDVLDAAAIAPVAFESRSDFDGLFGVRKTKVHGHEVEEWGHIHADEIKRRLRWVSLRRLKSDVLDDLPPKQVIDVACALSAEGADAILQSLRELVAWKRAREDVRRGLLPDPEEHGLDPDRRAGRKEQFEDHLGGILLMLDTPTEEDIAGALDEVLNSTKGVDFERLSAVRSALAMAKIPGMLERVEALEEAGEQVVVFSAHRKPIETLDGRQGWAVITGGVSPSRRQKIVEAFQAGELRGVGLTVGAGAEGVTLTAARYMVQVDSAWTPAIEDQAQDRIHRIGQERGVTIYRLVAEHAADGMVEEAKERKRALIGAIEWAA